VTASNGERPELGRAAALAGILREAELDLLLVTNLVNVRYLTGFTGSSGLALVAAEPTDVGGPSLTFFTDFRYQTQSGEQLPDEFAREIVAGDLLEVAAGAGARRGGGRMGFEEADVTFKQHARITEALAAGWELIPIAEAVERLRSRKDEGEVARIRAAAELADEALSGVLEAGIVGRTERDVAIELELRMRRLGAQSPSFPSIVAAGVHGALPHASPTGEEIPANVLVTIDWGALHEGYCSDCTRTYATGEHVGEQAREIYGLVLAAQERALAGVRAGPSGREMDALARTVIEAGGHGEDFGHGLGHGVGLEIHEGSRLSRNAGEHPLATGNVVTLEPGVYLPGNCGVRIEDLVVVREEGAEIFTRLAKELTVVP